MSLNLSVTTADTARRKTARDAVEVVEVAKASLDHGEQTLAIARKRASRLASIEGCKLLRQQPSCLHLVIVRVGDKMDLDALLVAAHCVARARSTHERRVRGSIIELRLSINMFKYSRGAHSERT